MDRDGRGTGTSARVRASMRAPPRCGIAGGMALAVAVAAVALAAAIACSSSDDRASPVAPGAAGGPVDAALVGETAPPVAVDAEPPPGDVCGDKSGLQATSAWPLPGGCPTRAGWSSLLGPQTGATWWTAALPTGASSPAVAGAGTIVWLGSQDGSILQLSSGVVASAWATGGPIRSSAAIRTDGTAVIGGGDGVLYGLLPGDGTFVDSDGGPESAVDGHPPAKLVFSLSVGAMASSPAIGADGTIYVATLDGKLVAVASDGKSQKWSAPTHDTNGSSPALGQDGTIYVGSSDHKLYAVSAAGTVKWATDLGAEIHASPAVGGDGTIYIGTMDGKLHAVTPAGTVHWSYATGGPVTETPAVYAGTVFVGSQDKSLHAVSTLDGSKRWIYATLGAVTTPLIGSDGTVYAGSADEHLYALTPSGTLLFAVTVKGRAQGALANTSGPTLYVATDTGLAAIGP